MIFSRIRIFSFVTCLFCLLQTVYGQQSVNTHIDIFSGVELNYRNIFYNNRLYDLLINLTPGVKWHIGDDWIFAAQGVIPVYNDYGDRYKKIRLNMTVLSKEFRVGKQHFKLSGGLFGQKRYGLDVKWMFPVNSWFALDGQVGYTGYCSMAVDWECSRMDRVTGWLGVRTYLEKYDSQRVDAIIQMGGAVDELVSDMEYAESVNRIADRTPVLIAGRLDGADCWQVCFDYGQSMELLMEYLIENGHREIALVGGNGAKKETVDKRLRYRQMLRKYGISVREEYIRDTDGIDAGSGADAARLLLASGLPLPTALIADNDFLAAGILILSIVAVVRLNRLPFFFA